MNVRAAFLCCLVIGRPALAFGSPALTASVIARVEFQLRLPPGAAALPDYTRWYTMVRFKTIYDLPFSTIRPDVRIRAGEPVVLGIFARHGGVWHVGPPSSRIVAPARFPQFVHGGCDAVNVIYSSVQDKILGVWCNVDDRIPPPPHLRE